MPFGPRPEPGSHRVIDRWFFRWFALCVVLLLVCGALTFGLLAQVAANRSQSAIRGTCQFFRDLSELPLAPTTTKIGYTIVADARIAYQAGHCVSQKGALPPPDPRIRPYLPPGVK